jgi:hypothetical protein
LIIGMIYEIIIYYSVGKALWRFVHVSVLLAVNHVGTCSLFKLIAPSILRPMQVVYMVYVHS